jgi:benzoate-CoA ligase family protein
VQALANRWGNVLRELGVQPEQRVLIGTLDSPDHVGALFGALKVGAVPVMVNPFLKQTAIGYFFHYTGAVAAVTHDEVAAPFEAAAAGARRVRAVIVADHPGVRNHLAAASSELESERTHRDDAAIWLFSGGTTGQPKAVVQTHRSFANSTECYAKGVLGLTEDDVTISVPKLFFGYAMGSNLFFPFSVGASCVLFPGRCTPEAIVERIERFRPTLLVTVPTMVQQMLSDESLHARDLSSLRLATSAGEALPVELHSRWAQAYGVELLDGLGTAEMWHVFLSNRPGDVRPGTLGTVVPGFDVRVRDDDGRDLPDGETGWLWVRGQSRAIAYWRHMDKTMEAFRGEWYVSGDMVSRDANGAFTYAGRGDDMLKVSGRWLSPQEVENCLLQHAHVREACVVGVVEPDGLTRPHAYVVTNDGATPGAAMSDELKAWVGERLESYKIPRRVAFLEELPRTHLGKVDRGKLRTGA